VAGPPALTVQAGAEVRRWHPSPNCWHPSPNCDKRNRHPVFAVLQPPQVLMCDRTHSYERSDLHRKLSES